MESLSVPASLLRGRGLQAASGARQGATAASTPDAAKEPSSIVFSRRASPQPCPPAPVNTNRVRDSNVPLVTE